MDFLSSIVTPIYHFIEHEVLTRRAEDVHLRVMYDDITECFWQRRQLACMLPSFREKKSGKLYRYDPHKHAHNGGPTPTPTFTPTPTPSPSP